MKAGWTDVALGEICEFRYGKALKADQRSGSGWPVYGSNGPVGQHHIALTKGPIIVIGRKGSYGEVHYSDKPAWPIDTAYFVDQTSTACDLKWLSHRLGGLGLTELNTAAAVPGLNRENAYRKRLLLPPLDEQRWIARVLDDAEAVRASRRKSLQVHELLRLAIFADAFGDPHVSDRSWPSLALHEACDAIIDCPHSTPTWTAAGAVCLRTSNLTSGDWDWADTRFVSEETFASRSTRGRLEPGDIVLSREGTVGVAAIVASGMRACMGQRLVQVKPSAAHVRPEYLLRYLLSVLRPDRIARVMVGSTARHLNVKELRALRVPIPPIDLQDAYSAAMKCVRRQHMVVAGNLATLDALFASVQHRAFTGTL